MKTKGLFKWGAPLLIIGVCVAASWNRVEGVNVDLGKKKAELNETKRKMDEVRNQIIRTKRKKNSVVEELHTLDEDLSRAERQLNDAELRLDEAELNLGKTKKEMQKTLNDLAEARKVSSRRLVAIYKNGNLSYLEILLSGVENFSDFVGRVYYMRRMTESDHRIMTRIQEETARLETEKRELNRKMTEISNQKKVISDRKKETAQRRKEKESAKKEFEQKLDTYEDAYNEMLQESRDLQNLIRKYSKVAQTYNLGGSLGIMVRPVPGPVRSGYGMRFHPIMRKKKMHTGVDLAASSGDPIHAAAKGVVIFAGYKRGYGYTVILQHGGNYQTLYAHCSSLSVGQGQMVEQGQVIARVGSTGLATGPHLHFELRYNGAPMDPGVR